MLADTENFVLTIDNEVGLRRGGEPGRLTGRKRCGPEESDVLGHRLVVAQGEV
jgi:hypothetical protein